MPEHETPQGSFEIDDQGAFVVREAPSSERRQMIDAAAADAQHVQRITQAAQPREPEGPNPTRADLGYIDPEKPLPQVVTHWYSHILGRVVRDDGDIRTQERVVQRERDRRAEKGEIYPSNAAQRAINQAGADRARAALNAAVAKGAAKDEARIRAQRASRPSPPPPPLRPREQSDDLVDA